MASSLARHGAPMWRAASGLASGTLALALGLSIVYRVVNAGGWCLILRSLGEPVSTVQGVRIWLAAEACRWLPGSLWSFGSRAVLASRRGLPAPTVGVSLVVELGVTVAAWLAVAGMGCYHLRVPVPSILHRASSIAWLIAGAVLLAVGCGMGILRSTRLRTRLGSLRLNLQRLWRMRPDGRILAEAFLFYVAMGILNGVPLLAMVRSIPTGASCPVLAVLAANAVAWLAGFFALFAPGGLVVREACLVLLLAPWLPAEQAIAVALAWRLIQIVAEAVCFAGVALSGLPGSLRSEP
jgi:hypothetical protein